MWLVCTRKAVRNFAILVVHQEKGTGSSTGPNSNMKQVTPMKKIVLVAAALAAVVSLSACEGIGKGKGKEPVVTKG